MGSASSVLDFLRLDLPVPSRSYAHTGPAPLLLDLLRLESPPFSRNHARTEPFSPILKTSRAGASLSALDFLHLEASLPARSSTRPGPAVFACDFLRPGPFLPVRSLSRPGSVPFAMSLSRVGPSSLVPDHVSLDFSSSPQGHACAGPAMPTIGLACLDSTQPVFGFAHSELISLPRSTARLGLSVSASDLLHLGSTPSMRGLTCSDPMPSCFNDLYFPRGWAGEMLPVLAKVRLELLPSASDRTSFGPSLLLRSHSRLGLSLLVFDLLHPEPFIPSRSYARAGLAMPPFQHARSASLSSVLDCAYPGPTAFSRSPTHMGLLPSALDHANLGSSLLTQSPGRLDFTSPVLDDNRLGSPPSPHSLVRPGLATSISGLARLEPPLLILDGVQIGPAASLRSPAHLAFLVPISDLLHPDPSISLRSLAGVGSASPLSSSCRMGLSLLILDRKQAGSMLLLHGFARMEPVLLVMDMIAFDPSPSSHSPQRIGLQSPVWGATRMASSPPALDLVHLDFSLSLRDFARLELSMPTVGMTRLTSLLPASDSTATGSFLPPHSPGCAGLSIPVLEGFHLDSSFFLRSSCHLGLTSSVIGLMRLGFVFKLSVLKATTLGSALPTRSPACLEPRSSALDAAHLGSLLLVQHLLRIDSSTPILGLACMEASTLALDAAHPGLALSLRSLAYAEPSPLAPDLSHVDSFSSLRSVGCLGPALSLAGLGRLGLTTSTSDANGLESPPSPRALAHFASFPLALDLLSMGFPMPPKASMRSGPSAFMAGLSRVGPVFLPSVTDTTLPGSPTLAQSMARLASSTPIPDHSHLGPPTPAQSLAHMGPSLPALDPASTEPFLSARSLQCIGPAILAFDLLRLGPSLLPKSLTWLGSSPFIIGIARVGPVSLLLVTDFTTLGFSLPPRSSACLGSLVSTFDLLHLGSTPPVQSLQGFGLTPSTSGGSRPGFCLSALDHSQPGSPILPQSSSQLGSATLVLDAATAGPFSLPKSHSKLGLTMSISGLVRLGFVSSPPAIDDAHLDFFLLPKSLAHVDLVVLTSDLLRLEPPILVRSLARFGLAPFALDSLRLEPASLLQSFARTGLPVSMVGISRCGSLSSLPAIDVTTPGFPPSTHSSTCLSPSLLALDLLHPGLLVPPRSPACLGFMVFVTGLSCLGSASSLSAMETSTLGPALSLRSFARMDSAALASDLLRLGLALSPRSPGRSDLSLLLMGLTRLAFTLSVLDSTHPGSCLFIRSFARLTSALSALDLLRIELPTSLRSFARSGPTVSTYGLGRVGSVSSPPVMTATHLELSSFLHSPGHSESSSSVMDLQQLDPPLSCQAFAQLGPIVLLSGLSCAGLIFSPSIIDATNLGLALPARSFSHLDLAPLVPDLTHIDPSFPLRSSSHPGPLLLTSSMACLGFTSLVLDGTQMGSPSLLRSTGRSESVPLVPDLLRMEPLVSLRAYAHFDFTQLLLGLSRAGLVFFLPVTDGTCPGLPMPLHSSSQTGLALSTCDFGHIEFLMSARSSAHTGPSLLLVGAVRLDFAVPVLDLLRLGSLPSARSFAYPGLLASVPDLAASGSTLPLQAAA